MSGAADSSPKSTPWDDVFRFHFPEIPSTNVAAMNWLRTSQPGQVGVFTAAHQTKGRGQHGKIWEHRAQQDLAWSMALHFNTPLNAQSINPSFWLHLNMLISEAVKQCIIKSLSPIDALNVRIKWPNDLLVQHNSTWKKCAGILLENHWKGPNLQGIVIGIGLNIAPLDASTDWVALQALSSQPLSIAACQALLENELTAIFQLSTRGHAAISANDLEHYQQSLFGWNEVMPFEWKGDIHSARFLGVNETGQAKLLWTSGPLTGRTTSHVSAGELRWILEEPSRD